MLHSSSVIAPRCFVLSFCCFWCCFVAGAFLFACCLCTYFLLVYIFQFQVVCVFWGAYCLHPRQTLKHSGNTARSSGTTHVFKEVLGKKKTQLKEWISADTIHKLETRRERKTELNNSRTRAAKARTQEEYMAVDREAKRSIMKDKMDYIDEPSWTSRDSSRTGESEGPVPGDQEADRQVPADRQASDGQEREPTDKNQRTAETMGRTLQGAAEPPHSWLTTRHPTRRDRTTHQLWQTLSQRQRSRRLSWPWGVGRLQDQMRYQQKP